MGQVKVFCPNCGPVWVHDQPLDDLVFEALEQQRTKYEGLVQENESLKANYAANIRTIRQELEKEIKEPVREESAHSSEESQDKV